MKVYLLSDDGTDEFYVGTNYYTENTGVLMHGEVWSSGVRVCSTSGTLSAGSYLGRAWAATYEDKSGEASEVYHYDRPFTVVGI
jgi:hypothetical protein